MKIEKYYKQCKLTKGIRNITSWVESKMAIEGKTVYVNREPGWVIREVGGFALKGSLIEVLRDQNRRQRGVSDI